MKINEKLCIEINNNDERKKELIKNIFETIKSTLNYDFDYTIEFGKSNRYYHIKRNSMSINPIHRFELCLEPEYDNSFIIQEDFLEKISNNKDIKNVISLIFTSLHEIGHSIYYNFKRELTETDYDVFMFFEKVTRIHEIYFFNENIKSNKLNLTYKFSISELYADLYAYITLFYILKEFEICDMLKIVSKKKRYNLEKINKCIDDVLETNICKDDISISANYKKMSKSSLCKKIEKYMFFSRENIKLIFYILERINPEGINNLLNEYVPDVKDSVMSFIQFQYDQIKVMDKKYIDKRWIDEDWNVIPMYNYALIKLPFIWEKLIEEGLI